MQLPLAPIPEVIGIESDAEQVCGHEPKLSGVKGNHTDDQAVRTGDNPSLPEFSSHEDRRKDSQHAGNIIQSKHGDL